MRGWPAAKWPGSAPLIAASIRFRMGWNVLVMGVLGIIAIDFMLSGVIDHQFTALENTEISGHVERAGTLFKYLVDVAKTKASDWSMWDDAFAYLERPNPKFEKSNLRLLSIKNIRVNGIGYMRFDRSFRRFTYFHSDDAHTNNSDVQSFARQTSTPLFVATMRRHRASIKASCSSATGLS